MSRILPYMPNELQSKVANNASATEPGFLELKISFFTKLLNCLGLIFLTCKQGLEPQGLSLRVTVVSV